VGAVKGRHSHRNDHVSLRVAESGWRKTPRNERLFQMVRDPPQDTTSRLNWMKE
jgi:hypothetical protein